MIKALWCILRRDLTIAMRRRADVVTTLLFFVIVVSLFPLSIGADRQVLLKLGPGVLWIAALLASTLALERLFAHDYADGTLEQFILTPQPLLVLILGKIIAHWLVTAVPLILIVPLLGLQYGLPAPTLGIAMLSLIIGTPTLSLIGAIGAALTLGLRGGGTLLALLVLPLYIPVLIYGTGAITVSIFSVGEAMPFLALLGAMLFLALSLAPLAATIALRIAME